MEEPLSEKDLQALKAKKDEEAAMMVVGREIKATYCRTCVFCYDADTKSNDPEKCHCMAYPYPQASKPNPVYFDGARCDFFLEIPK